MNKPPTDTTQSTYERIFALSDFSFKDILRRRLSLSVLLLLLCGAFVVASSRNAEAKIEPTSPVGPCQAVLLSPNAGNGNNFVTGIAAISPNDAWVVGYYENDNILRSLTMHWNGSTWSQVPSPNPDVDFNILFAVDAISSDDIWAVGEKGRNSKLHFALHWDGVRWLEVPIPNRATGACLNHLSGVTAISGHDVWAAGYTTCEPPGIGHNVTLHWDGSAWSHEYTPNLTDGSGTVLYNTLNAIDALATDDIWAVGRAGSSENPRTITMHWDGYEWSLVAAPSTPLVGPQAVAAISHNDVWAAGTDILHWDGTAWTQVPWSRPAGGPPILGLAAAGPDNVWAIGTSLLMRWDGLQWNYLSLPDPGPDVMLLRFRAIASTRSNPEMMWGAGWIVPTTADPYHTIMFRNTCYLPAPTRTPTLTPSGTPPTPSLTLTPRNSRTPTSTHTPSSTGTATFTGTATPQCGLAWRSVPSWRRASISVAVNHLNSVAAISANDVWAVGSTSDSVVTRTLTLHWDGSVWDIVPNPSISQKYSVLLGVMALSPTDVWAVGSQGSAPSNAHGASTRTLIEHWDGEQWSLVNSPNIGTINELSSVGVSPTGDLWAVGYSGSNPGAFHTLALHWTSAKWSLVPSPRTSTGSSYFADIAVIAHNDAWAVGWTNEGTRDAALTAHWDGAQWNVVGNDAPSASNRLYSVSAVSTNDIWAVGRYGLTSSGTPLIERWNGTAWARSSASIGPGTLYGVVAESSENVWAVGNSNIRTLIIRLEGNNWRVVESPNSSPRNNMFSGVAAASSGDVWAVGTSNSAETLVARFSNPCLSYTSTPTTTPGGATNTPTSTRTFTPSPTPGGPDRDASMLLLPEGSAPPNGGIAHVGDKFVLGLWVNGNSHFDAYWQQSYLTFTYSLLQNARVDSINGSCVITNTVTEDPSYFETTLQNEVCNGPNLCNFRGRVVAPGSLAFASFTTGDCPDVRCNNSFRVAQIGLCAVAPGRATLHWEFSPPGPSERDTEILDIQSLLIHSPKLFSDYSITISP